VFVDTSAILALLISQDRNHEEAVARFNKLKSENRPLVCNSYILLETYALLGRRIGLEAVVAFRINFAPLLRVMWVDESLHEAGLNLLARQHLRDFSLVDAVSFVQIEQQNLKSAFSFDRHFIDNPSLSCE
jgi:predicted nucleic acid-binding protein